MENHKTEEKLYPSIKMPFGKIEYSYSHELLTLEDGLILKNRINYGVKETIELCYFLISLKLGSNDIPDGSHSIWDVAIEYVKKVNTDVNSPEWGNRVNDFIAGSSYERSKLPELIKEVLKRAADSAKIITTIREDPDWDRKYSAHEVDKQSILSVNCDDLTE